LLNNLFFYGCNFSKNPSPFFLSSLLLPRSNSNAQGNNAAKKNGADLLNIILLMIIFCPQLVDTPPHEKLVIRGIMLIRRVFFCQKIALHCRARLFLSGSALFYFFLPVRLRISLRSVKAQAPGGWQFYFNFAHAQKWLASFFGECLQP